MRRSFPCLDKPREVRDRSLALFDCRRLDELLRFATAIAGRYIGADRAEEFGRRNAVPGELLVHLHPDRVIATADVAGD